MIEPLADMPPGTIGFKGHGKFTRSDYTDVLIPPLRKAVESGERVRLLFQIGPGFDGVEAGALWEEAKADVSLGLKHLSAWERTAVISDEDWVRSAVGLFGWMSPGKLRHFSLAELESAKEWLIA